jgi:3-methylfumaryl-CoA hydratase
MSSEHGGAAIPAANPRDWVGRVEERTGALPEPLAGMLGAALSHPSAPAPEVGTGAPLPPLWHWAAFPDTAPMSALGADGHPAQGRFLPPLPQPRRMWAGGALAWRGALTIGEPLRRRSEILSVTEKRGGSGPMVFVQVRHDIVGAAGAVEETQDIVYLDIPEEFRPPRPIPAPEAPDFAETVPMSPARLFRYSAATFNAHRIHYDLAYARGVEKYPGLVVHGPMQASLLLEAACRHAGAPPRRFAFKGVHPMFHDRSLRLMGSRRRGTGMLDLCTAAEDGPRGLQASMEWDA